MKKFFLAVISFLILTPSLSIAGGIDIVTTTFPSPDGIYFTLNVMQSLKFGSQPCPVSPPACSPGLVIFCPLGLFVCQSDGTWTGGSGSSVWNRTEEGPGLVKITPHDFTGHDFTDDVRLGFGTDAPRAQVHIFQQNPSSPTSLLRLEHVDSADAWWQFNVKDITDDLGSIRPGMFIMDNGIGGLTRPNVFAMDTNGTVFIADDIPSILTTSPSIAKVIIQNNKNAFEPAGITYHIRPDKLAAIFSMNKNESGAAPADKEGPAIGFSASADNKIDAAIGVQKLDAGGGVLKSWIRIATRVNPSDAEPTVGVSISPRGRLVLGTGTPLVGGTEKLEIQGDMVFNSSGSGDIKNVRSIVLYSDPSGVPPPPGRIVFNPATMGSISNMTTEPALTAGVPTSNHNAATTEFVQNAIMAASVSGTCFVAQRTYTLPSGPSVYDVGADTVCTGGTYNFGGGNIVGVPFICPNFPVINPYPTSPGCGGIGTGCGGADPIPPGKVGNSGYIGWTASPDISSVSYLSCQHLCCFP